jgi:hypothetical protein
MILDGRPCGSTTRKPGRWTRKQIEEIAKQKGLKHIYRKTMDVLCHELSEKMAHQRADITVKIQGCITVTQYDYESSESRGHIVLIGENHSIPGNTTDLLQELLGKTRCAVDICIEKAYQKTEVIFRNNDVTSLTKYFYLPPIDKCSTKGYVLKQDKIRDSIPAFWKDCIEPYRGRVKIWATDFRYSGMFGTLMNTDPDETSRRLKTELFEKILMYDAYKKDKNAYNETVKNYYRRYMESRYDTETVRYYMKVLHEGKNHTRLMHDLEYLPKKVLEEWLRIVKTCLCKDFSVCGMKDIPARLENFEPMFGIMDLYTALRIIRLVLQDENRIILFFGGNLHRQLIDKLLTAYSINADPPLFHHRNTITCGNNHNIELVLPDVPPNKKTRRMIAYQSRHK